MKKVFFSLLLCFFCFSQLKAQFSEVSTPFIQGNQGFSAWLDYDNDGDLDILVNCSNYIEGNAVSYGAKIYKNTNGVFSDIGIDLGLFYKGDIDVADYDGDGDVDLAIMGKAAIDVWGQTGMTKIFRNDNGVFKDINAAIPQICNGAIKWGDIDNDGDQDLVMTGYDANANQVMAVVQNNKGVFTLLGNHGLPAAVYGAIDLADFNKDGYIDVLISGGPQGGTFTAVFKNNKNNTFSNINQSFVGMSKGSVKWGDYDADGDLDFVVTGTTNGWTVTGCTSIIYRNDNGTFVNSNTPLLAVFEGRTEFGDLDNDGDLELVLTGGNGSNDYTKIYQYNNGSFSTYADLQGGNETSVSLGDFDRDGKIDFFNAGYSNRITYTKLYKNTTATVNSAPTAPSNLKAVVTNDVTNLSWNAATDTKTPAAALEYNFYIGTSSKTQNIAPAMSDLSTGYRRISSRGNAEQNKTAVISKLRAGTYYWSVQAIDGAFAGSSFAAEQTFTVVATLAVSSSTASIASTANSKASFNISSNIDWKISSNQTWLKLGTTSGSGSIAIELTTDENPSLIKRTAIITITGTGVATKTITVTQDASPAKLMASLSSLGINAESNSTTGFNITANVAWTLKSNQTWVSLSSTSGTSNSTITVMGTKNTSLSPRTATLTLSGAGVANKTITLTQKASDPFVEVSVNTLSLDAKANNSKTFVINSNTNWILSSSKTWLSFSKTSGSGNETITVTTSENPELQTRQAYIYAEIPNSETGSSISATQNASSASLSVSTTSLNIAESANSKVSFNITSNTNWSIKSNQTWATINLPTGSKNSAITVTASANATFSPRTATLTISANGIESKTITLTQKAAPQDINVSTNALNFDIKSNNTQTFIIGSSSTWTITSPEAWLSFSKTTGTGDESISVTVQANTSNQNRTATINIKTAKDQIGKNITITQTGIVTAVDDLVETAIEIYPNPVSDILFLGTSNKETKVAIYNLNGTQIMDQNINVGSISLAFLPSGIYIISITTKDKTVLRKFVKQ